jgi:hypothetical protein
MSDWYVDPAAPWVVRGRQDDGSDFPGPVLLVASISEGKGEDCVIARKAAAAPDLLDALERLVHMAECNTAPGPSTLAQARAAIARARGESEAPQ